MSSPWTAPEEQPVDASSDVRSMGLWTRLLLGYMGLAFLMQVIVWVLQGVMTVFMPHTLPMEYEPVGAEIGLFLVLGVVALGYVALLILGMPLWIYWHVRAASNLRALGHDEDHLEYSPASHAYWWFVPFANLFYPYYAMQELVRTSTAADPEDIGTVPSSMGTWWACWLVGNILSNLSLRLSTRLGLEEVSGWIDLIAAPISLVAMALYASYVWTVYRGQRAQDAAAA